MSENGLQIVAAVAQRLNSGAPPEDTIAAVAETLRHRLPADAVAIACSAACLTPGSEVTVDVRLAVPLPFVPAFVRHAVPLEVPVTARRTAVVDEYREGP